MQDIQWMVFQSVTVQKWSIFPELICMFQNVGWTGLLALVSYYKYLGEGKMCDPSV